MEDTDLLKAIYASATDYAIVTMDDQGVVTSWNPGAEKILGYHENEILGQSGSIIFTPEDRKRGAPHEEFHAAMATGRGIDNRWHVRKDGSRFWGEGVVTPIRNASAELIGFVKIMRDNTARKQAEDEAIRMAFFDNLTGLPNRTQFQARYHEMIADVARSGEILVLQVIDLDFFKHVNDSLGHAVGDQLLRDAAQRMTALLRETDFLARMGGDEFVVLQAHAHSPQAGATLANKLLEALSRPFEIAGHEVRIGASIGIAIYPQDAREHDDLMEKADLALYRIKKKGRGGFGYFTKRIDAEAHQRAKVLIDLRQAVEQQAFMMEYQPQFDCNTGQIVALEALLRCTHPLLSRLPVDRLITTAGDAGLMPKIGMWVMQRVWAQQWEWQQAGIPSYRVSINLSPQELMSRSVADQIRELLGQPGVMPETVEIEVTERDILDTRSRAISLLEDMRARGVSVVLDDFGSGYSSLSYLRRLPINRLKLDRQFIAEIPRDPTSCKIVEAVIEMAHAIRMEVIAEGVESGEQTEFLKQAGCDALQGFFFSPALPPWKVLQLHTDPRFA